MKFIENIKSSIYNPAYYAEILNKPFSNSLKYFLSLAAVIALITTIMFSFSFLPKINSFINEISPKVLTYYPDNLEITVKNGIVSTNVEEPYFIKIPSDLKNMDQELKNKSIETTPKIDDIENLLVIDTASPLTIDLFKNYKTAALLSRDSFAIYDNGAVKINLLPKEASSIINKSEISAGLNKIMPYVKIILFALVPIVLIFSFIGFVLGNLIYLIFGAAVIWLAAKIRNRELDYSKSFQVGLHAITLGVILEATIFYLYPRSEVPFLFTFLMIVVVWVNLNFASGADNIPLPESKKGI